MSKRKLYESTIEQIHKILGPESRGLKLYKKDYEGSFLEKASSWEKSYMNELIRAVDKAQIVFLADFHAFDQSQRGHLRILRSLRVSRKKILCVEFFEHKHQKWIDQFIKGKISESQFLSAIRWDERWGFPWENFRPIIEWARSENVSVVGVNKFFKERNVRTLKLRDQYAAEVVRKTFLEDQERQIIIIFGELHMAPLRLPQIVRNKIKLSREDQVIIYQNSDELFFRAEERRKNIDTEILKKNEQTFCVQNSTPWLKWQSYLRWLETSVLQESDEENDPTEHVAKCLLIISKELRLEVNERSFGIYLSTTAQSKRAIKGVRDQGLRKLIVSLIEQAESFYVPSLQLGFLAKDTVNQQALLAMDILIEQQSSANPFSAVEQNISELIWREMLRQFGSKILNPKRKILNVDELKQKAGEAKGRQSKDFRQAYDYLMMLYYRTDKLGLKNTEVVRRAYLENYSMIRLIGEALGNELYSFYQQQKVSLPIVQKIIKMKPKQRRFESELRHVFEILGI